MRVKAFAKVNLTLEVLGRRPDGFHDLRTIFQTISLPTPSKSRFRRAPEVEWQLIQRVKIPNNIMVRAAEAVLEETNVKGLELASFRKSGSRSVAVSAADPQTRPRCSCAPGAHRPSHPVASFGKNRG